MFYSFTPFKSNKTLSEVRSSQITMHHTVATGGQNHTTKRLKRLISNITSFYVSVLYVLSVPIDNLSTTCPSGKQEVKSFN